MDTIDAIAPMEQDWPRFDELLDQRELDTIELQLRANLTTACESISATLSAAENVFSQGGADLCQKLLGHAFQQCIASPRPLADLFGPRIHPVTSSAPSKKAIKILIAGVAFFAVVGVTRRCRGTRKGQQEPKRENRVQKLGRFGRAKNRLFGLVRRGQQQRFHVTINQAYKAERAPAKLKDHSTSSDIAKSAPILTSLLPPRLDLEIKDGPQDETHPPKFKDHSTSSPIAKSATTPSTALPSVLDPGVLITQWPAPLPILFGPSSP
ncbi:MAG: hypothetical protein Q9220_007516 [cf. Caloplaca sp. 1 TL-2023]